MKTNGDNLVPIGFVRSPYGKRNGIPIKRGVSRIEILDAFGPGLTGLTTSSHIIVLGHLHLAERDALKASPRCAEGKAEERGIFSVRSPARPNPVGYTVVKLLSVNKGELIVEGLDFVDGTPIIDVKPYSPGWDSIHSATRVRRIPFHEMDPRKTLDLLVRDALNYSGFLGSDGALAVLMVFVLAARYRVEPRDPCLRFRVNRQGSALDALIGMTGATFASGRIEVVDGKERALVCRFESTEVTLVMRAKQGWKASTTLDPEAAAEWIEVIDQSEQGGARFYGSEKREKSDPAHSERAGAPDRRGEQRDPGRGAKGAARTHGHQSRVQPG